MSKSGTLYNCTETSTACQAKSITRAEAAAVANIAGGMPLDSPNAYSDDDQNIFQKPLNGLPYFGIQVCFGGTIFRFNQQMNKYPEINLLAYCKIYRSWFNS